MLYNIITSQPIEDFLAERRGATRPLSFDFTWMHFTVIILSYVREAHHMSSWIPYRHSEYTFLKTPMHKNTHPPTHTHTLTDGLCEASEMRNLSFDSFVLMN